jgi:hypothetical protein
MKTTNIIDKTKFSQKNMDNELDYNYQIKQDCQRIKSELKSITEYYYLITKKTDPWRRENLTEERESRIISDNIPIHNLKYFDDIKTECGIDFSAVSKDLSNFMQDDINVTLFRRSNRKTEHYIEIKKLKN